MRMLMQHDRENVTDDAMVVEQEMQIPVKLFEFKSLFLRLVHSRVSTVFFATTNYKSLLL